MRRQFRGISSGIFWCRTAKGSKASVENGDGRMSARFLTGHFDPSKIPSMTTRAINLAEGWADLGLFEEAAAELERLPLRSGGTAAALKVWIRIHSARGEWVEVERICEKFLRKRPRDHSVRLLAAEALHRLGRSQDAVFMFAETLRSPQIKENAPARYSLARFFCGAGNLTEAREVLRSAIERDRSLWSKALRDPDLEKIWIHFQK